MERPNPSDEFQAIDRPHALMVTPIFRDIFTQDKIVGNLVTSLSFDSYMSQLLPDGVQGIDLVITNSCGQAYSYALSGNRATYLGPED